MQSQPFPQSDSRPLCVDLDGTLVRSDLLAESVFTLLKQNILYLFVLPIWLLKGKAYFKQQVSERVDLDASLLPYHAPFLAYLKQQHAAGRQLILVTGSNVKFAELVARHVGFFDHVLASDGAVNLTGHNKLERLRGVFGDRGFDYAGNAEVDLTIWAHAGEAVLVNPDRGVRRAVEKLTHVGAVFDDRSDSLRHYAKAMRLHQWLKNLLVFVPLITSHQIQDLILLSQSILAFLAFGLCASSVYLLNDLIDLPTDRQHVTKRHRPFAAGSISISRAVILIPALLAAAVVVSLWLPLEFLAALALYYVTTLAYSFRLKRVALVDVLVLAGLYTLRIIAGAAAISVIPSFWLLAFSMFLFLSLALVKRYTELLMVRDQALQNAPGRGYYPMDLETLAHFGTSSGYMAVLVLALYINSDTIRSFYTHPNVVWLLCPVLLYFVSRIWMLARRNEMHEDPLVFAIRDSRSQLLAGIFFFFLWVAA